MAGPNVTTTHIKYVERAFLNDAAPVNLADEPCLGPAAGTLMLWRVTEIPRVDDRSERDPSPSTVMEDVLTGLAGSGTGVGIAVVGDPASVSLYVAAWRPDADQPTAGEPSSLESLLAGVYPGLEVERVEVETLGTELAGLGNGALLTGSPAIERERQTAGGGPGGPVEAAGLGVDRLIRSLTGDRWAYVVAATPIGSTPLETLSDSALNELRSVQNTQQRANAETPIAAAYQQTLQGMRAKLRAGRVGGAWHVAGYVLADDPATLERAKAVATGVFGGSDSYPDTVRALDIQGDVTPAGSFEVPAGASPESPGTFTYPYRYPGVLSSPEVAGMLHLPRREAAGFHVRPQPRFDVTPHQTPDAASALSIGTVLDAGRPTNYAYALDVDNLTRHGLVVGTTGSGKTNTVFHLLRQLDDQDVPLLVVEPAKTEYRALLDSALGDDLQVFTLGDETTAPFRINPFEIRPGVAVQTHIDHLTALFNASFVMYAPMPYVLEQCIHEIYEDRGWDLVTGENRRGRHPQAHPTLTDLYEKIDEVVAALGYDQEITRDVTAALKTRIDNLRIGSKGLMLDTQTSVPIEDLLSRPTVLELDAVGDDAEKAFLMGLVLYSLYEHYQASGASGDAGLGHVTVVEEAHRLLSAAPAAAGPEASNMAGQAVASFTNLLAEIRAYGEGVLVVDQTPAKLAPAVVKNTNLKVVHRLLAADDRSLVGGSMGAGDAQTDWLGLSGVGEAVVFSGDDDQPILVDVPYGKLEGGDETRGSLPERIRARAGEVRASSPETYEAYPWAPTDSAAVRRRRRQARDVVASAEFRDALTRCVHAIGDDAALAVALQDVADAVAADAPDTRLEDLLLSALILGVDRYFEGLGEAFETPYEDVEDAKASFLAALGSARSADAADSPVISRLAAQLEGGDAAITGDHGSPAAFRERYASLFASETCPCLAYERTPASDRCRYHHDVARLVDDGLEAALAEALAGADDDLWERAAATSLEAASRILPGEASIAEREHAALCYAVQASEALSSIDARLQSKLVAGLATHFDAREGRE